MTFLRYIIIQIVAYFIDLFVFLIAFKTGILGVIFSNFSSKASAGIFAFIAHRNFTFKTNESTDGLHQGVRYFILLLLNIPFSSAILALLLFYINETIIAKILSDVISVGISFWLAKSFVFIKKKTCCDKSVESKDT